VRDAYVDNNDTTKAVKVLSGQMRVVPIGSGRGNFKCWKERCKCNRNVIAEAAERTNNRYRWSWGRWDTANANEPIFEYRGPPKGVPE